MSKEQTNKPTLGTFAGVFTPSILTILGLILFLKTGYVVGSAGLIRALLIVLLANSISVLTSISLSAIATNLRVKGGGDYYLISRTLGVQYGGALGIVLFLAQSVSIAFYAIGLGEVLTSILGLTQPWWPQVIAAIATAFLFVLAWLGADWAARFQYVVLVVLFLGITAFYVGAIPAWDAGQLRNNLAPAGDVPFWVLFAIFFPAVTGFTQGVSMSGDLRDPGKSLPRGTFMAVGLSMVIYISVVVLFAGARPGAVLVAGDTEAMGQIAAWPWLVAAGAIAATLSSSLASFLGAPRILQSLATDRVFPFLLPFAKGHGLANNPRRGILLSAVIAYGTIILGNLNAIAPVVSMFFLISYGLLNYATYFEARGNSPSFRPRFRFFHARLSLLGCLVCLGAMLAINPTAGALAVAVLFAIHHYLSRSVNVDRWVDSDRSRRFQRVREDLLQISADQEHSSHWRPVLLAFSDNPERRGRILRFASWLEGNSGLTTIVRIVDGDQLQGRRLQQETYKELEAEIERQKLPAFPRVILATDLESAAPVVIQAHGLGPVRANTVLLNWYNRDSEQAAGTLQRHTRYMRLGLRFGCNLVLLSAGPNEFAVVDQTPPAKRRIDVWYRDNSTGQLSLLLAYLMTRTDSWEEAKIRLLVRLPEGVSNEDKLQELHQMLEDVRIEAEPVVVTESGPEVIVSESATASLVFLPFCLTGEDGPTRVNGEPLDEVLRQLGITALVLGRQKIDLDAEPEEGPTAEAARVIDAATDRKKDARQADNAAVRAEKEARKAGEKLAALSEDDPPAEDMAALSDKARQAEQEAERSRRRAMKARAKADEAAREAGLVNDDDPSKDDGSVS